MATAKNFVLGSRLWVEDKDLAWVEAEVVEVDNERVKARTIKGSKLVNAFISKVHAKDVDVQHGGVDDMTKLSYLHEPGVLYNLASRFELNDIYTYTGNILIAVNPFAKLPHLYDAHMMEQYRGAPLGMLSPHVFAVADSSYTAMINEGHNQSILVSGESGAGKTETTKLIMQYLAHMGGRAPIDGRNVEQQVLESNPLLEAFGNAKTVRNDNSSRFGKFVEIQFDRRGRICGAAIRTYLLEMSRVVQITDPERNYHCFYQLCASPKDVEKYRLGDPKTFHYLNQSNCFELAGVSNSKEYANTKCAMDIVGINLEEQEAIFRTLAAILHLGNIYFAPGKEHDSSLPKDENSRFHLQTAAELLMVDTSNLENTLCSRVIATKDESIIKTLDPETASINRDALAKTIYSHLFDWLVEKINKSIGQDADSKGRIGVLDIYGFESFPHNSFEQFCINFANEKLQQHFNQHVFKMEQAEYSKEAINWSYIEFIDNQDVLDLIEKKSTGIIALLDEACMFPKSTNETFATKLFQSYRNNNRFKKPKLGCTDFILSHYAGEVAYQTDLFIEKNKDYVVLDHQALLGSSKCPFLAGLFPSLSEESFQSSYKFSSIATRFKQQLQALMETLSSTEPHYIRCVKPNDDSKPGHFENASVLHQLRCGGVLEAIRISCAGYPTRRTYDEFLDRYALLACEVLQGNNDERTATDKLLKRLNFNNYQLGRTKVFLRAGQMAELDTRRAEVLNNSAKLIQRKICTFLTRKIFLAKRKAAISIQAYWRGHLGRLLYEMRRREAAAIFIQKHVRMWISQKAFKCLRSAAIIIEAGVRAWFRHKEYKTRRQTKAVIKIQAKWRGWIEYSYFIKLQSAVIVFQCAWRTKVARKELKQLKLAARERGALQEAKTKLEKRCEILAWHLQLEKRLRIDAEESKMQELVKIKSDSVELHHQVETLSAILLKEKETNKLLSDQLAKSVNARPTLEASEAKIQRLSRENEQLKTLVNSLEKTATETEKELARTRKESEEHLWKAKEADSKINKVEEVLQRLKEKMSNLESENQILRHQKESEEQLWKAEEADSKIYKVEDVLQRLKEKVSNLESENQVLRQQVLLTSPTSGLKDQTKPIVMQGSLESYQFANGDHRVQEMNSLQESLKPTQLGSLSEQRQQKVLIDRQKADYEALLQCVTQDVGFSHEKPIAACTLYKCFLHWHSFESEQTNLFDRIIQIIGTAIEGQENNDSLAYWLSNTSTLLFLLHRNLKPIGPSGIPQRRRTTSVTLLGRMTQSFRSPSSRGVQPASNGFGRVETLQQVETKYPALIFKQQLTTFVQKIYGIIRDNVKEEITPLLSRCIQAPRTSRVNLKKVESGSTDTSASAQQLLCSIWHDMIKSLDGLLNALRANHVPPFLICKIFAQIFCFINVQLFNSLLLRRECCSFSHGEYVKAGLAELEHWIFEVSEKYLGRSWEELKFIRQAVGFLVIHQKSKKSLDDIMHDLCPVLSVQQLYRISTMYWDDKYGTHSVAPEVIANMKKLMTEDSHSSFSNSFLLDDDSSIPFTLDDISKSMPDVDLSDIDPPSFLREVQGFEFLKPVSV